MRDPVQRMQAVAALLANLNTESAPAIAELFFESGVEGALSTETELFMRAWAQLDGAAAITYLEDKNKAGSANGAMLAALGGWASKNPESARAWAEGVENGGLREDLLYGVIDGWALVDFRAAAEYAETRPRSNARTRYIDLLFRHSLTEGGTPGAQRWFEGISDNDHNQIFKRRAFEKVVKAMLAEDPSVTAAWIANQAHGRHLSRGAVESTAMKLAESSPEGALQWLSSMTQLSEGIGTASQGKVLSHWAGNDPGAAGNWLSDHGDDPHYDALASNFSAAVAAVDSERAMEWALSIQDEKQRRAAQVEVARRQIKAKGESAIEDLRLAGLTEDEIAKARQNPVRGITFNANGLTLRSTDLQVDGGGGLQLLLQNRLESAESSRQTEEALPLHGTLQIPSPPNR